MSIPPQALAPALDRLRRGDPIGARNAAEAALAEAPDTPALLEFAGLLAVQTGDIAAAANYFRRWVAADPGSASARLNLATALVQSGDLAGAREVCVVGNGDPKLARLAGYIHQELGELAEAAKAYEAVVASAPDDFESWNNLGNVRLAQGQLEGAIVALGRAVTLRSDFIPIYLNLSETLAQADRPEDRRTLMAEAARLAPQDAKVQMELGMAEAGAANYPAAERAFREAIRLDPRSITAYVELGMLLENMNQLDALDALVVAAEENGVTGPELDFLRASTLRRQGRFAEALAFADAAPPTVSPVRRAHLLAELNDRLGRPAAAFDAYREMNAAALATRPPLAGTTYREMIQTSAALLTPEQVSDWTPLDLDADPPAPAFIVGFPRSGTTLLDTLLMNMPQLHVLEEQPVLHAVEGALGDPSRLSTLSRDEANLLRRRYFEALARIQPAPPETTIVDKFPLHMTQIPLIHRLFPDARIIFVERHPCDAVLSCFMSNFQLNRAMRSFTDLEEAALTYDAVFDMWTRATSLLPINVHRIRYERMVSDLEAEMRPVLDFLGLPWDPRVLDNRASAAKREHIRTASYAQVTEPIYRRSSGRWQRYRDQLAPVLPILAPWAERMGYEI
jgi:tetratricopeptide (TPR) repeat protein